MPPWQGVFAPKSAASAATSPAPTSPGGSSPPAGALAFGSRTGREEFVLSRSPPPGYYVPDAELERRPPPVGGSASSAGFRSMTRRFEAAPDRSPGPGAYSDRSKASFGRSVKPASLREAPAAAAAASSSSAPPRMFSQGPAQLELCCSPRPASRFLGEGRPGKQSTPKRMLRGFCRLPSSVASEPEESLCLWIGAGTPPFLSTADASQQRSAKPRATTPSPAFAAAGVAARRTAFATGDADEPGPGAYKLPPGDFDKRGFGEKCPHGVYGANLGFGGTSARIADVGNEDAEVGPGSYGGEPGRNLRAPSRGERQVSFGSTAAKLPKGGIEESPGPGNYHSTQQDLQTSTCSYMGAPTSDVSFGAHSDRFARPRALSSLGSHRQGPVVDAQNQLKAMVCAALKEGEPPDDGSTPAPGDYHVEHNRDATRQSPDAEGFMTAAPRFSTSAPGLPPAGSPRTPGPGSYACYDLESQRPQSRVHDFGSSPARFSSRPAEAWGMADRHRYLIDSPDFMVRGS